MSDARCYLESWPLPDRGSQFSFSSAKTKNSRDSDDMEGECDYVDDGDDLGVIHLLVLLLVEGVWSCLSCELPLFP